VIDLQAVPVGLGERAYDIVVGPGALARSGEFLKPLLRNPRVVIVTDTTVAGLHLEMLTRSLKNAGLQWDEITLAPGEERKSFPELERLVDRVLDLGIERGSMLLALGGGVIGDLTGFAASITLRGIDYVQLPTTLLAQVDSSVGGKTAINTRAGKNLAGSFYQPRLVLADTKVLDTLPKRELLAGYAEVVKYGLINDAEFFAWLEGHGAGLLDRDDRARVDAVVRSCQAKSNVVAADEREAGSRALLNFGHTFGHALESACGYGDMLLHGEAVAIGMIMAFDLSVRLGLCPAEDAARVRRHLAAVGLPTDPSHIDGMAFSADDLRARMATDKKVRDGKLVFVLTRGIGEAFVSADVRPDDLLAVLEEAVAA